MSVFSERLRKVRNEKGIKQADIAEQLGVSVQSYSAYENGREPNYDTLVRLAALLDVDSAYLVGESQYKKSQNAGVCELTGLSEKAVERLVSMKRDGESRYSWLNGEVVKYADILSMFLENDERLAQNMITFVNERAFYAAMSIYMDFGRSQKSEPVDSEEAVINAVTTTLSSKIVLGFMDILQKIQAKSFTPNVAGYREYLVFDIDDNLPQNEGGGDDGDD